MKKKKMNAETGIGLRTHSIPPWLGWGLYSFLENRGIEKQKLRQRLPRKLINVNSPGGMKGFAEVADQGAGWLRNA